MGVAIANRVYWTNLKVQSIVAFSWQSYSTLLLAELLMSKEKSSFFSPVEVVKWYHFLLEMQSTSFLVGVSNVC